MCGIAGILSLGDLIKEEHIRLMADALTHRGPDAGGMYINKGGLGTRGEEHTPSVGFGHRRLSIIDLSTGEQPIHNEDKQVWIVFNGEIYNFQDLKEDLIRAGHRFYTTTDTEVIVHLYEQYGDNCVKYLRGMFAFAIWDQKKKRMFVARDRFGKKPLYYYWNNKTFLFASELKGILACPDFKRTIDKEALANYLQYGYIPDPMSIFEGVYKLLPGHVLILENGKLAVNKYWDISFKCKENGNEEEVSEQLLEKLKESVKLRLISDVPLGAFLSGGIDSSTIVAIMAQEMSQPVKTFSIGFEEPGYNELPFAREVARLYQTDHHEMIVRPGSFDLIEKIVQHFDEPFGDESSIPTYYVSKLASDYVKVVLSGDGGDEVFAGYDSYSAIMHRNKYERIPECLRSAIRMVGEILPDGTRGKNFLYNISLPLDKRFIDYISHVSLFRNTKLLSGDLLNCLGAKEDVFEKYFEEAKEFDALSRLQYVDMKIYLPGDGLVKVDRMSMAHSLETRAPLLDQEVVEFVNRLPYRYKLNGVTRKYVFKKVAAQLLPKTVLDRKKQGFAPPLRYWFKGELKNYVKEILFERRTDQRGYFKQKYVRQLFSEYERGGRNYSKLLWHLLVLEIWHRLYMDR